MPESALAESTLKRQTVTSSLERRPMAAAATLVSNESSSSSEQLAAAAAAVAAAVALRCASGCERARRSRGVAYERRRARGGCRAAEAPPPPQSRLLGEGAGSRGNRLGREAAVNAGRLLNILNRSSAASLSVASNASFGYCKTRKRRS